MKKVLIIILLSIISYSAFSQITDARRFMRIVSQMIHDSIDANIDTTASGDLYSAYQTDTLLNTKVNKTTTVNGNALSGNITLTRSSFAVGDSATNSVQGFMTGADHTKLMNMQANAALSNQTFINDSIDCSRVGGTNYLSYTVASNITLTGKRTGRVSGGYILVKLVGNGTNTVTLEATNMVYASGVPAFDKTLNKVNVLVIVWVWGSTTVPSATYPYLIVSNISF